MSKDHPKYYNSGGQEVPSVTTVLGIVGSPGLMFWANKIGKKKIDYWSLLREYANIGTLTHALVNEYFTGGMPEDFSEFTEYEQGQAYKNFSGFMKYIEENEIRCIMSERGFVSDKYNYGGTLDLYCEMKEGLTLVDFKTSADFRMKFFLQLMGYTNLLEENGHAVERGQVVLLREGDYETMTKTREELERFWKMFRACIITYKHNAILEADWR
jgi:hypothetical protein